MSEVRFEDQFPEPLRCWIVHAPKRWPGPEGWWLDLAREELVEGVRGGAEMPASPSVEDLKEGLADVAYLPPVAKIGAWWRRDLRERLSRRGACPVVQFLPGEEIDAGAGVPVVDLTPALLSRRFSLLGALPAGVHCCWPLIPGVTADESFCRQGLERLAKAGVSGVQAMTPNLSSTARRKLGELTGRRGYQELFHGSVHERHPFSRWAHELGLEVLLKRPACGRTGRALSNRRIATGLHLIGELVLRTGGSVDESLSFYRAGRWADRVTLDIEDLARSGNLALVPEASGVVEEEIQSLARSQPSLRLTDLEREYRGEESAGAPR